MRTERYTSPVKTYEYLIIAVTSTVSVGFTRSGNTQEQERRNIQQIILRHLPCYYHAMFISFSCVFLIEITQEQPENAQESIKNKTNWLVPGLFTLDTGTREHGNANWDVGTQERYMLHDLGMV